MPVAGWLGVSLPLMTAMLYLFFTAREKRTRLIAKGGATWAALMTAAVGRCAGGGLPQGEVIVCAMALFVLADVLLEIRFIPGVAAFALGHIAVIGWTFAQATPPVWSIPLGGVLYAFSVFLFRKTIRRAGKKGAVMLVYALVLTAMAAAALSLAVTGGAEYIPFALGAAVFMISDLMVAQGILVGLGRRASITAMILYETAVMLMALSCWPLF